MMDVGRSSSLRVRSLFLGALLGVLLGLSMWSCVPVFAQDGGFYTVAPGDTLSAIAGRFGVPLDALISVNGIEDPNALVVGQQLVIPDANGAAPVSTIDAGLVRARPGDSIASLAVRLGEDPARMAELNGLDVGSRLFPGQPIKAPVAAIPANSLRLGAITDVTVSSKIVQGYTGRIEVTTSRPVALSAGWLGQPLVFTPYSLDGLHQFALMPVPALQDAGVYDLVAGYTTARGAPLSLTEQVQVETGDYESQEIVVPDDKAAVMTADAIQAERDKVVGIWSQVSDPLRWVAPFARPIDVQYATTSPFGTRRAYSVADIGNFHAGQDYGAPEGAVITAPAAGVVVLAEPLTVRGNAVILDHGRGIFTGYWHMSESKVTPGQLVAPGDVLGLVGNTGLSTGAHLHWELRINGVAVDPTQFLDESPIPAAGGAPQ